MLCECCVNGVCEKKKRNQKRNEYQRQRQRQGRRQHQAIQTAGSLHLGLPMRFGEFAGQPMRPKRVRDGQQTATAKAAQARRVYPSNRRLGLCCARRCCCCCWGRSCPCGCWGCCYRDEQDEQAAEKGLALALPCIALHCSFLCCFCTVSCDDFHSTKINLLIVH